MAIPGVFFVFIFGFSGKYLYNMMWKSVHPVFGARIRTHDILNTSLLPKPLDRGPKNFMFKLVFHLHFNHLNNRYSYIILLGLNPYGVLSLGTKYIHWRLIKSLISFLHFWPQLIKLHFRPDRSGERHRLLDQGRGRDPRPEVAQTRFRSDRRHTSGGRFPQRRFCLLIVNNVVFVHKR